MKKFNILFLGLAVLFTFSGCVLFNQNKEEIKEVKEIKNLKEVINTKDLIGSWLVEGADYESILLENNGTFQTFLHDKPFSTGTWLLEEDYLGFNIPESPTKSFDSIVFEKDMLILTNLYGSKEIWKEVKVGENY